MTDRLVLSEAAAHAMRRAAPPGSSDAAVHTTEVLLAIIRHDTTNPWDYITLHTGDADQVAARYHPDPPGTATEQWEGRALTSALRAALDYAGQLSAAYGIAPIPSGLLALALVAEPNNGATRSLLEGTGLTHRALVDLIHQHLLDAQLDPGPLFPPWHRGHAAVPAAGAQPEVDQGGPLEVDPDAGAFDLFRAAVAAAGPEFRERLEQILIPDVDVFDQLAPDLADERDKPAHAVLDQARDRFDTEDPSPAQIVVAATVTASDKVAHFCQLMALEPVDVAAVAAKHDLDSRDRRAATNTVAAFAAAVFLGKLAVSWLVIADALAHRHWLQLGLLWLVWMGHPQTPAWMGVAVAVLLGWLVGPAAGAVHLIATALEVPWAQAERHLFWARTGVRLTLAQHRHMLQRAHTRYARLLKRLQRRRMMLRTEYA
jgi:hypothetical protein